MKGSKSARFFRITINALRLLTFPAAEVGFMALAWILFRRSLWGSAACVIMAAVALSYSLHIVFHEVVHRKYFRHPLSKMLGESAISILLGTPFNEYRQSHWRHHRHTNLLQDTTSTWASTPNGPKPRHFWSYSLGWPAMMPTSIMALVRERREGRISNVIMAKVIFEGSLLIALHIGLAYFATTLWCIYTATIYLGYVGIAAINYMQHPPVDYGSGYTSSIYRHAYNRILYNNGLHFEHHDRIQEPVIELRATPGSGSLYSKQYLNNGSSPTGWHTESSQRPGNGALGAAAH